MGRTATACARCTRAGVRSMALPRLRGRVASVAIPIRLRCWPQYGEGGVLVCSISPSVLLWSTALLAQVALELLCQLFTADRSFAPSRRTLGWLGRSAGLTL